MTQLVMTQLSSIPFASPGLQSGSGTFEPAPSGAWAMFEAFGPWVLIAAVLAAIARAAWRWPRYRAVAVLDDAAREAVRDAVAAAERRTVGEILPVVVERSDPHPGACWLAAISALLVGSALLEGVLPWGNPFWLLLCQLGIAAVGYGLARLLPDLQRSFVSEGRATAVAEEQAFQEFYRQGLQKTEGATGVLIFVSLLERRVVVLGDEGIAKQLPEDFWVGVREAILGAIRRGSLRDGLIDGIQRSGEALAGHAPWQEGDRDEIPNRVIVRRE